MSSVKKAAIIFGAIGLGVPITILLVKTLSPSGFSPAWIVYIWPSFFLLGGLSGKVDGITIAYLVVSVLINVAVYAYVGIIIGRIWHRHSSAKGV